MTDRDKITIVGIAINASLFIASMVLAWFLNRKSIHATLQSAQPAPKPKKKRKLTATERRLVRSFRMIQIAMLLLVVTEPYGYFRFSSFPPVSVLDWIDAILSLGVMVGFTITIILFERNEIKQLKSGEFVKRLKRIARERQEKNVQRCK